MAYAPPVAYPAPVPYAPAAVYAPYYPSVMPYVGVTIGPRIGVYGFGPRPYVRSYGYAPRAYAPASRPHGYGYTGRGYVGGGYATRGSMMAARGGMSFRGGRGR